MCFNHAVQCAVSQVRWNFSGSSKSAPEMRLEASPLRPGAFQGMSIIQRVILPCLPKFYLLEEHFSLLPVVQGRAQFFFFLRGKLSLLEWEMLTEQWASSRENRHWIGELSPLLYQGYKEWDRVLWVICWLDEACILGGGRVRQIPSPYGVGGKTGYTAQEDLKSVNNYNMGERRTLRVWFFRSCIPRPFLVLSALSSLGHYRVLSLAQIKLSSILL